MQEFIFSVMERFGYPGLLFLIMLENLFPPIPSEIILPFGGFMTTYTNLSVGGVVFFSTIGSTAGAWVLYRIGALFSPQQLERILDNRVCRLLGFKRGEVEKAVSWFEQKGSRCLLYGRCVPIIRSLISIPAGMAGMHMVIFLPFTILGSFLWNVILVNLGIVAGGAWEQVVDKMGIFGQMISWGMVIGIMLATGALMKHLKKKM